MSDEKDIQVSNGYGLKDLFPGYYRPTDDERKAAYDMGIVSLDANALLDLYRFTAKSREELFRILELLKARIFITHQAALEFQRNVVAVVEDRISVVSAECDEIKKQILAITERVRGFSNRHQVEQGERDRLVELLSTVADIVTSSIEAVGMYDLNIDEVKRASDPVILRLAKLLEGRVGGPLVGEEQREATKEAERRRKEQIPPGYSDRKKDIESHRDGDYLIWRQLLKEAKNHDRPVLLVSNENKEDWIRKSRNNENLGPRPELVREMRDEAESSFFLVSVVGLLKEAPTYLGVNVSESTITEAESLPVGRSVSITLSKTASRQLDAMSYNDNSRFTREVERLVNVVQGLESTARLSDVYSKVNSKTGNRYLLRWSSVGRAIFSVHEASVFGEGGSVIEIVFYHIGFKKGGNQNIAGNEEEFL